MNNYKHLSLKERDLIEYLIKQNKSLSFISKELGRNKSTMSRELKKNKAAKIYLTKYAQFTTKLII